MLIWIVGGKRTLPWDLLIRLLRPCQRKRNLICFKMFWSASKCFDLLQNVLICFKIFQASQAEEFNLLWMPIYGLFLGSGQLNLWTPMPLPLVIQSRSNSSAWLAWKILKQIKFLWLYWLKQPFKAEPYGILSLMIYKWVSLYTTGENCEENFFSLGTHHGWANRPCEGDGVSEKPTLSDAWPHFNLGQNFHYNIDSWC